MFDDFDTQIQVKEIIDWNDQFEDTRYIYEEA
jgi:hypothetical protein